MKLRRLFQVTLLILAVMYAYTAPLARTRGVSSEVILIRINTTIDYRIADLVASAAADVAGGAAAKLLLEIDTDSAYYTASMQLVDRLSAIKTNYVAYIGPSGASASSFSTFLAMASGLLVMNAGSSIGNSAVGVQDAGSINYLAGLMRSLANLNGRNAEGAAQMVTANVDYSAETAYSQKLCDFIVQSYEELLSTLQIDPASVVERKLAQYPTTSNDAANALVRFLADPFVLRSMFAALGVLVLVNLIATIVKPRRSKLDEVNRTLFELIRMEVLSPDRYRPPAEDRVNETQLQTLPNTPSPPPFRMSRVPTHPPDKRVEKPIEVRKR